MGLEIAWSLWKLRERHNHFHLLWMRGNFVTGKGLPCLGMGLQRALTPAAPVP